MDSRLIMHELHVNPKLRRAGIASRLVSSMVYIAKEINPDRFSGIITSPHTPNILQKVLGESGVTYLEYKPRTEEEIILPITTEQAISSIKRVAVHGDPEYDGIVASINLDAITLGDLEKPDGAEEVIDTLRPKFDEHRAA